ncbi:hypothetical protein HAPAU_17880 [Halalkalicoccus paucihalophilus]|uniref:DUF1440 domain-containing protein n=2 Tax=Halalkalicoccus paucihalophilus TaxID=1008153 RepID=A0A151AGA0_9EURY|nr:hypothetical protein HAPAU_17880 [Halalkalicoccus paucihalophilus]
MNQSDANGDGTGPIHVARSLFRAAQGGAFATVVMTVFRLPILRSLPPSANFWAKYVGNGHPEEYTGMGILLHFLYGISFGALFGLLYPRLNLPESASETEGVVWGTVFGLALSVFGERVMLNRLLDIDLGSDAETVFHASHAVYGIALGTWVGSRIDPTRSYEEYEHSQ